jgi:hypothetical protein
MSTFKDMVAKDVLNVFQNVDEFAEHCHVIYNKQDFGEIPVILDETQEKDRDFASVDDHGMGVFAVDATLYVAYEHMNCVPEKGQRIWLADVEYGIETSACEMGQITLGLRRHDE